MSTKINLISKMLLGAVALLLLVGCSGQAVKPEATAEIKAEATSEVEVKTESEPVEPAKPAVVDFCSPDQGAPFSYRKKVAVLAADVRNPLDANDLPGLDQAWSELLQQRLRDSGRLLVVDARNEHLYTGERQKDWITSLAKRLDVQFLIVVRFQNLHTVRSQFGVGDYGIPLPGTERQIDAELMIFDGYYGTQMASIFHSAQAKGKVQEVVNSANRPVLRGEFLETTLGKALNSILNSETEDGLKKLACLPLMASVIKVAGDNFYISARGASLIHPGDTLQLFRLSGQIETRLGPVEIIRVYPESSVGVYKGGGAAPSFSEGLRVRAW